MMRYVGIDPSSKTGFVALCQSDGLPLEEEEITTTLTGVQRIAYLVGAIGSLVHKDDVVCIEGFSHGSKGSAVDMQYGIGWAIRLKLHEKGIVPIEVAPTQVKKFATGSAVAKKEDMILPIYKKWEYENPSDNIRDAFVLAQIAQRYHTTLNSTTKYQQEVIDALKGVKKKKKTKEA